MATGGGAAAELVETEETQARDNEVAAYLAERQGQDNKADESSKVGQILNGLAKEDNPNKPPGEEPAQPAAEPAEANSQTCLLYTSPSPRDS